MTETLTLRDYQRETLVKLDEAIAGGMKRPAVVLPTGAGKTVVFSHLCQQWTAPAPKLTFQKATGRVLILVHRDELIRQTVKKLNAVAPELKVGVVKAKENDHEERDIIVASVQTVAKLFRLDQITASGEIGMVIVDECHHAAAESYVSVLNALGCFNDESPTIAVGFTATMSRADKKGLGDVWEDVVYRRDILDMIADKYLTDVQGRLVTVDGLSLSQVAMRGGDYSVGSLSEALLSADAPKFAADAWIEHAKGSPGIVFTPSVETAQRFADAFREAGISCAVVWGAMGADERQGTLKAADAGEIQVLINCMVLTEGFDWPRAQTVMIARPTTSAALYVQMVGRVLRPYPGKETALVLDIVGASQDHRLATLADLTTTRVTSMQEGESLYDAVARERESRDPAFRHYTVSYEDVDLFQQSHLKWLQTRKGVWFLATRDTVYFVWPGSEPETYKLGVRPIRRKGGNWLRHNVELEEAMEYAEDLAERNGGAQSSRASWRRQKASESMIARARRAGIMEATIMGKRQGELSDLVDVELISRLLDGRPEKKPEEKSKPKWSFRRNSK